VLVNFDQEEAMRRLNIAFIAMKPIIELIGEYHREATDADKQSASDLLAQAFQLERSIVDAAMKQEAA
jgi:very-short-patch-repair endonuclease